MSDGQLHLATLTRLWLFPRYLYRVGDKALGTPINLRVISWALLLIPIFWVGSNLLPGTATSWMGTGLIPRLILPGLLVYLINTKVAHGAKPWEVASSWLRMAWHMRRRPTRHLAVALTSRIRTAPTHAHAHHVH